MGILDLKSRPSFALLVGTSVSLADLAFHALVPVEPMETFLYFFMKGIFAFVVAAFLFDAGYLIGSVLGGVVFTFIMSGWYYLAYITYNPALSSCVLPPTYNCTIPGVSQAVLFHFGNYPVTTVTMIEGVTHAVLFFVFFLVWKRILSD